ncbi:hypothetical protein, partial [Kitasatospora sp. NPDC059571]|uniref:hypothetical protein n=1 Tax=Kitasatospora sp. NPDC059571 TaxID=3346871 RepID=UPI00367F7CF9
MLLDHYEELARRLGASQDELAGLSLHVADWRGDGREAHDRGVSELLEHSGLEQARQAALRVAAGVRESRAGVVKAKYQVLEISVWLTSWLLWAAAQFLWTLGGSAVEAAAAETVAQTALAAVRQRLLTVLQAAASGAGFMGGMDLVAQGIELKNGDIDAINWESVGWAALTGAVAGEVGLGLGLGWHGAKGLVSKSVGEALGTAEETAGAGAASS